MGLEQQLSSYLRNNALGEANAVPAERLCRYLGISERELRELRVKTEKLYPVLSDPNRGYWFAASPEEVERVREKLRDLIKDNARRRKSLKFSSKDEFSGQQMSWGV